MEVGRFEACHTKINMQSFSITAFIPLEVKAQSIYALIQKARDMEAASGRAGGERRKASIPWQTPTKKDQISDPMDKGVALDWVLDPSLYVTAGPLGLGLVSM